MPRTTPPTPGSVTTQIGGIIPNAEVYTYTQCGGIYTQCGGCTIRNEGYIYLMNGVYMYPMRYT